jgi:hypothetical protein
MPTDKVREAEKATESKSAKLRSQVWNDRVYIGVDLPWRGSIEIVARQSRFFDQILALAELPGHAEWPKILAASHQYGIPSIWNRVRPSPLESSAAALLTALAFTNPKEWVRLVNTFFKSQNLTPGSLRGRPRVHPRDMKDMNRGIQIDKLMVRLEKGFEIKLSAKQGGGFASGDEQVAEELRTPGYCSDEIKAILKGKTLQDAGYQLYMAINGATENVTPKGIRNSYARYKLLSGPNPLFHRRSSHSSKDS